MTAELTAKSVFNQLAPHYDDFIALSDWCGHKVLFEAVAPFISEEDRILDIGFGTGALMSLLDQHGCKDLSGIDVAEEMVAQTKNKFLSVDIRAGDIQKRTSFDTEQFDVILGAGVTEYIGSLSSAAAEVERLMRKGGLLGLTYELPSDSQHGALPTKHYSAADLELAFAGFCTLNDCRGSFDAYKYVGHGATEQKIIQNGIFLARKL